jgi:L-ascorbate metabolism protein UlaG (beta-lactamase superfamily)
VTDPEPAVGGATAPPYRWLGHATVLLGGPPTLAVDPWRWRLEAVADAALVTHAHADHCSEDDLADALRDGATVGAPAHLADRLERTFPGRVLALSEGVETDLGGARVLALPSEGPRRGGRASGFHPRGAGLAYLVETPAVRALLLGDSAVLPEHEDLAPHVAFVAVGGLVTMTPEEAAEGAERLGADVVVPVHWGDLEARHLAARRFVELCHERGVPATVAAPAGNGSIGQQER